MKQTPLAGAKLLALGAVIVSLAVFLSAGPLAVGQDDKPAAPAEKSFEQKMKDLEKELAKIRQAMLKEIDDENKRTEEAVKKAREDAAKASKGKDKAAAGKAREALAKAEADQRKLQKMRAEVQRGATLGATPTPRSRVIPPEERLGIHTTTPSPTLAGQLGLPKNQGLVIDRVDKDSAAAKAGFQVHDVILQLDGKPVPSSALDFRKLLAALKPDAPVEAVVIRQGKQQTIKVTVPAGPPAAGPK